MLLQTHAHDTTAVDRVLLAAPRSFCAGVEMAIKALAWLVRTHDAPVYCYHEIVHNRLVVERFRRAGVVFVDDVADVPDGAPLMLSAHGSSPEVAAAARARTALVVDAVCPLVQKVHHEVRQRAERGHVVVYAGHAGHDEARGTLAVAPGRTHLVERPADVAALSDPALTGPGAAPVAFLAQTTLGVDEWRDILAAARERFGDVWVPGRSDLCFATTNRQAAVRAVAPRCDALVVIGSRNSSNTRALERVARQAGTPRVVRVDGPGDVPADLGGTVGVTAGASAPEHLVRAVVARLAPREGVEVVAVTAEDEYFPPPRALRDLLRRRGEEHLLDDDRSVAASDVLDGLAVEPAAVESVTLVGPGPAGAGAADAAAAGDAVAAGDAGGADASVAVVDDAVDGVDDDPVPEVGELLGRWSAAVDAAMAEVVDHEVPDPWLRHAIGYHLGWRDERFAALPVVPGAGGKKLRATFAVLAYLAARDDGGGPPDPVLPFAAAVELVHNWSLVHDDIEDGDRTRRGRPALWTLCGEAHAINAGDCLYALGLRAVERLREWGSPAAQVADLLALLARTAVDLTVGQMRDLTFETVVDISVDDYLGMIEGKTAALLRATCHGGSLVATGDPAAAAAFGEFGRRLGLSFQIRDDVLGIWGTDRRTGKPTGADIRRRKKSLPVVLALAHAPPGARAELRRLYGRQGPLGPDDEQRVRDLLDAAGARDEAQRHARRHRAEALAALAPLARRAGPTGRAHLTALEVLADFVTERDH
ncbi:MAG TPA: 4-hydroxy-3-methylbut-2-enyl diphosphate reductase [Acidimicrobiales bacterium]